MRPAPAATPSPAASARAGLIGFGEAYMAGDWDADDLPGVLTVFAGQMATLVPPPLQRLRDRLAVTATAERRAGHPGRRAPQHLAATTTCPTTCSRCSSTRRMTYSSALFDPAATRRTTRRPGRGPARKIDRLLDAPASARARRCWRSAPAGASWPSAPPAAAPSAHRHPVRGAARTGPRAGRRGRPGRPGHDRAVRLPRQSAAATTPSCQRRDDRGGRRRASGRTTSHPRPRAPRPAAGSACRPSRCRTTGCWPHATPTPGSTSTSSPAACPSVRRSRTAPAHGRCGSSTGSTFGAALRRDAAALAGPLRAARRRGRGRSASTRSSAGCGRSTSPTPRPASASGYLDVHQFLFEKD